MELESWNQPAQAVNVPHESYGMILHDLSIEPYIRQRINLEF